MQRRLKRGPDPYFQALLRVQFLQRYAIQALIRGFKSAEFVECFAAAEIGDMESSLDKMLADFNPNDRLAERKVRSLESQIEVKMSLLDTLRRRENALTCSLSSLSQLPTSELSVNASVRNRDAKPSSPKEASSKVLKKSSSSASVKLITRAPKSDGGPDDADLEFYQRRARLHKRGELRKELEALKSNKPVEKTPDDAELEGGLRIPGEIWARLYDYQRTGVRWLWQLHRHGTGGILGDEMGLGKTIQIIAFLAGLRHSRLPTTDSTFQIALSQSRTSIRSAYEEGCFLLNFFSDKIFSLTLPCRLVNLGPVLIVCPATVLSQWLSEFRTWIPTARVVILHSSGSGYSNPRRLISSLFSTSGFVLTTYGTLMLHRDLLLPLAWQYLILDEGHKIKNPEAEITMTVKRFLTPHKLIVSGTPMQNNLKELWSIFDFVNVGKLGSLPDFLQNFAVPITQGGYATSSPVQVETAYRCACTLRNLLAPFLLRRLKSEVRLELPKKSEQVLFCRLTYYQRSVYEEYLGSRACKEILNGRGLVFKGLILLKALCNHPDLITGGPRHFGMRHAEDQDDLLSGKLSLDTHECRAEMAWEQFGCPRRSGKLMVTLDLLRLWHQQGHKALVFTQSRRMLRILEKHLSTAGYAYLKMDGTTPVAQRQKLVELFNSRPVATSSSTEENSTVAGTPTPGYFVFLLTTRVGGLGVNLVGANRVLIYDPDWNPSTDAQARERAWRIGQSRDVIIYRLLTSGTLEEKIYQRQIFKQFLTNRVLNNPKQQRFFKTNDLQELFSLADDARTRKAGTCGSESVEFFKSCGAGRSVSSPLRFESNASTEKSKNRFDRLFSDKNKPPPTLSDCDEDSHGAVEVIDSKFNAADLRHKSETPEEREARLRALARRLSRKVVASAESSPGASSLPRERKRKHGTRVDGHRIRLVERRTEYDEGNDLSLKRSRLESPKRGDHDLDPFVLSVLCRRTDDEDATTSSVNEQLEAIRRKRAQVDEHTKLEAVRVAETALRSIHRSSQSSAPLASQPTLPSVPKSLIGLQNQVVPLIHKRHRPPTITSTVESSLRLQGVTAVDQEQLMNEFLLSAKVADPALSRIEADRLTVSVLRWLKTRVLEVGTLRNSVNPADNSHPPSKGRFGVLKNRFLWSAHEETSPFYVSV
ncbi:unnamed protein product [Schistocephalus solidus]|uniref:DNA excision repair protein ERCC-6 n=1 Tax=Schistocephalus solidus TaxID=70667 RepID=A0A183SHC2_SCHSO|nr:unnamed protein product [Schistocephalus solidus]